MTATLVDYKIGDTVMMLLDGGPYSPSTRLYGTVTALTKDIVDVHWTARVEHECMPKPCDYNGWYHPECVERAKRPVTF